MVTADVIGLYPNIPHDAGLKAFRKSLDNRENKKISTDDLTKMAEFVLQFEPSPPLPPPANAWVKHNGGVDLTIG